MAMRWFWMVFGHEGIFGVRSRYFPEVFALRELIEVISQAYQANRCSNLVPRRWINNIMISLLVANCWSTPVLKRWLRDKPAFERLACLSLDLVLDIGINYHVLLAIFVPYYAAFDVAIYSSCSTTRFGSRDSSWRSA